MHVIFHSSSVAIVPFFCSISQPRGIKQTVKLQNQTFI